MGTLQRALGDLGKVRCIVSRMSLVNSTPDFTGAAPGHQRSFELGWARGVRQRWPARPQRLRRGADPAGACVEIGDRRSRLRQRPTICRAARAATVPTPALRAQRHSTTATNQKQTAGADDGADGTSIGMVKPDAFMVSERSAMASPWRSMAHPRAAGSSPSAAPRPAPRPALRGWRPCPAAPASLAGQQRAGGQQGGAEDHLPFRPAGAPAAAAPCAPAPRRLGKRPCSAPMTEADRPRSCPSSGSTARTCIVPGHRLQPVDQQQLAHGGVAQQNPTPRRARRPSPPGHRLRARRRAAWFSTAAAWPPSRRKPSGSRSDRRCGPAGSINSPATSGPGEVGRRRAMAIQLKASLRWAASLAGRPMWRW